MSTTENRPSHHTQASDTGHRPTACAVAGAGVVAFDVLKRRKRLAALEATRSHLATMAGQQRSHGLDDADESSNLQLSVETTIRDEFPDAYEERSTKWLENDLASEHPGGVLAADCGICRSIATASGLNLVPPEVA
jgi:hypothetical protein